MREKARKMEWLLGGSVIILCLAALLACGQSRRLLIAGKAAVSSPTPWITAESLGTLRADGSVFGKQGVKFTTGGTGKTVTSLGLYKVSTNVLTRWVFLTDSSCNPIASNLVDYTSTPLNGYVYGSMTPSTVTLSASTVYYLWFFLGDPTATTVEGWYGGDTTVTETSSFATIDDATTACIVDSWGAHHAYGPINLKFQ